MGELMTQPLFLFRSMEKFPFTLNRQTRVPAADLGVLNADAMVARNQRQGTGVADDGVVGSLGIVGDVGNEAAVDIQASGIVTGHTEGLITVRGDLNVTLVDQGVVGLSYHHTGVGIDLTDREGLGSKRSDMLKVGHLTVLSGRL